MSTSTTTTGAGRATAPTCSSGTGRRRARRGPRVLIVHGIAEHSGRYEHVGAWLAAAGLDVHAYDQRGFGGSGGRRGLAGALESEPRRPRGAARRGPRVDAEGRPVVLYGHSLGGLIALGYAVADPPGPCPMRSS